MRDALTRFFASMKTWTLIFGVTLTPSAALLAKHGFNVSDDTVRLLAELMSLGFAALLGAQGLADHGKEAARLRGSSIEGIGGDVNLTVVRDEATVPAMPTPRVRKVTTPPGVDAPSEITTTTPGLP